MIRHRLGAPRPQDFILMAEDDKAAPEEGAGPLVMPINQMAQANRLMNHLPQAPDAPAFEGFRLHLEHGISNPLRDFPLQLVELSQQGQRAPELPAGLLEWITRQEQAIAEMGGNLRRAWEGITDHERTLKQGLPPVFAAVQNRLVAAEQDCMPPRRPCAASKSGSLQSAIS